MKLQLDTENKTIKLESTVELSKLVDTLESLLPNGLWKEFTLEANTTITHWSQPYIIKEVHGHEPYVYPWWKDQITYMATNKNDANYSVGMLNAGKYNIEA